MSFLAKADQKGFTLVELIVVMGIIAILLGLASLPLIQTRSKTAFSTTLATFLSDLKSQQGKAMSKNRENGVSGNYGIYFAQNSYTLFAGDAYSPSDSSNFTINLDNNLIFNNVTFPSSSLIFSRISGEIVNFSNNSNSLTITDTTTNTAKTIQMNKLGVVVSVN